MGPVPRLRTPGPGAEDRRRRGVVFGGQGKGGRAHHSRSRQRSVPL